MKSIFLKIFAGASIKSGVAFALQVCILLVDALRGILAGDSLSDEKRGKLAVILTGAIAVRDFLQRLAELIGAPLMPNTKSLEEIVEKADSLDRITDSL